ncbi:hypothetical protein B9Z55_000620 [Caenorhabditis nigoni]|nr:hypothetical protein B9Z55_000620 [Caenorhabditis nigoni]
MIKLIKSSQVQRFNSIHSLNYDCCLNVRTLVYISSKHSGLEKLSAITEREETNKDYFQLNVSGKMLDFQLSDEYEYPVAAYHLCDKEIVIKSIHEHFINLFGDSVEYRLGDKRLRDSYSATAKLISMY